MSDTPPSDPPPEERPGSDAPEPLPSGAGSPEPERRISTAAVIGGAVLGFIGTWFVFAVTYMSLWGIYGESTSPWQVVIGVAGLLALPVIACGFMISPRTRQAGAGLLMGVAIGSVVGAGMCAANIGLTW